MTPPPGPALLVLGGLAWNLRNSLAGRPTISGWACRHKEIAVPIAAGFSAWWVTHWSRYIVEASDGI